MAKWREEAILLDEPQVADVTNWRTQAIPLDEPPIDEDERIKITFDTQEQHPELTFQEIEDNFETIVQDPSDVGLVPKIKAPSVSSGVVAIQEYQLQLQTLGFYKGALDGIEGDKCRYSSPDVSQPLGPSLSFGYVEFRYFLTGG